MLSCKKSCGGKPQCKLGVLTNNVQIYGGSACYVPSMAAQVPTHHKILVVMKSPDMKDRVTIGHGRNVDKLKDLLALASIDTSDVYVTGLIKCTPPGKRNASVQEVKACAGHLADELRLVDPDVVVLMGNDALRAFNLMGQGGVTSLHGQVIKKQFPHDETLTKEYTVVVTTDPNALYMNPDPKLEGTIVKDLILARSLAAGESSTKSKEPAKYRVIKTFEDLDWMVSQIKQKGVFSVDTESRGLPWSVEPLICISFCWGYNTGAETAAVLPMYNHDPNGSDWKLKPTWNNGDRDKVISKLKEIFEDPNIPKIAHNIKYDMCVLRKHTGLVFKGFLFDTMLMHHVLWEHPPHDLEYLSDIELQTGDYSKELHKITGHGKVLKATYDHVPDDMMWEYTAKDVESTYRLMMLYYPRLKAKPHLWSLYQDEVHPFIRTLYKAEWFGVKLDANVIDTLTKEFEKELEQVLISLRNQTWPDFNPSSSEDVARAIREAGFGNDIFDPKRTKGYSTNKAKLLQLAPKLPLVEEIIRFRTLTKLTSTYLGNAKELIKGDGKARIGVLIHGTVNGRPSAPFLHQIPRLDMRRVEQGKGNLRDMFIASPGSSVVYLDFSQIELVILAIQAGDSEMLKVFKSGEDIHKATAAAFLNLPLDEVVDFNRSIGKSVNFGRVYGSIDGYALMKLSWMDTNGREKPITEEMIKRGFASLDDRFPAASAYFKDTVELISACNGTYTTRFGREKHMGTTLNMGNEWARREAEIQAVNGSIQSPAASVTIRALNAVDLHLNTMIEQGKIKEEDAYLIITVHDSGAWEVKNEHIDWFVPTLTEIAGRPVPQLDNFRFTSKVGIGNSWSSAELNSK